MKIVFTSTGKNWDSPVDSVFGRTEGFLVYNEEKNKLTWFSNEGNKNAGHGAGVQAGQSILDLGADILITGGDIGPKAFDVLKKAGVKVYPGAGKISIREAFSAFKNNKLREFTG